MCLSLSTSPWRKVHLLKSTLPQVILRLQRKTHGIFLGLPQPDREAGVGRPPVGMTCSQRGQSATMSMNAEPGESPCWLAI